MKDAILEIGGDKYKIFVEIIFHTNFIRFNIHVVTF